MPNRYNDVDTTDPNFRHVMYTPDTPSYSGSQPAVIRVNSAGQVLTSAIGSPATLLSGTTESGTTSATTALESSTTSKKVTVQANYSNGSYVLIGNSTLQEVRLDAGESIDIEIDNLNKIYFKSGSVGANVEVAYVGS